MKNIKEFIKFVEGLLYILIIPLMFYWLISLINLPSIKPLISFFGFFFNPLLNFVRLFGSFTIKYDAAIIDFSFFILAASFIILSLILSNIRKSMDYIEEKADEAKIQHAKIKKEQENLEMQQAFEKELNNNKIIFLKMSFNKSFGDSAHLYKDSNPDVDFDGYVSDFMNFARKLNAKVIESSQKQVFNIIFYDIYKVEEFLLKSTKVVKELNENLSKSGLEFYFKIAISWSYNELNSNDYFNELDKIISLSAKNQALSTILFKEKYVLTKKESLKFESSGIYILNNTQTELFKVIV